MRRWRVVLCTVLVLAVSCTGSRSDRVPSMATPTASLTSTPEPSTSPAVSDRVVLTADLSETPEEWRKLFFVPFGTRREQLGFKVFHESVNSQPSSFAVAADGSVWIADRWKDRLAHFLPTGRFLGAIALPTPPPAISIRGQRVRIRDLVAASAGRMYALFDPSGGPVARIEPDGAVVYVRPQLRGRDLWVAEIFPTEGALTLLVGGFVNRERGFVEEGPTGFFQWEPPGAPTSLQGLPSGKGSFVRLERLSSPSGTDQDFELHSVAGGQTFAQPFHVDVRTGKGPAGRSVPAEVGPGNLLPTKDDLIMYVMLTPSRAADARRYGGGRWLLRLGKSPVLWERLPNPGIPDEPQTRHLALGPNGSLYLMVAEKGGVLILRRP